MQTLYTLACMDHEAQGNKTAATRILNDKLDHVLDIFTVCMLYTVKIAQYAATDADTRAARYLRNADDMNVDTRMSTNTYVLKLTSNASFGEKIKKNLLERFIDEEWVKKIYLLLVQTDEYQRYIATPIHTPAMDKELALFVWEKQILGNEGLVSHFADELPGWEDDAELITMLMQNFYAGNMKVNFLALLSGEKKDYAHDLLVAVIEKEPYTMQLIEARLANWDKERVAVIDMLLLRMGVCELLYFPTIPTKVTINEYIDIAKQYSTPQSGQFVNGVLDNILKGLASEDKINKQDRHSK